jgi:hypothetical protein
MFDIDDRIVVFYNATVGEVTVQVTHKTTEFVRGTVEGEPEGWEGSKDLAWKTNDFAEKVASGTIYAAPPQAEPL